MNFDQIQVKFCSVKTSHVLFQYFICLFSFNFFTPFTYTAHN